VSTLIENIVLRGYFSKIPHLIKFQTCNLAVTGCSIFLPPHLYHWRVRKATGSPLLPANAITSEKLGGKGVIQEKSGYQKIKKIRCPTSTKKEYFRLPWPTNTIISPSAVNTSVASGPAGSDAKAAPAAIHPLEETMTARMLNRLVVASATISLSLSRYGNHRHPASG
jgi:hypothetical protein